MATFRFKKGGKFVYDWDRVDMVLREMVPKGHHYTEVCLATGIPVGQIRKRARMIGIPFSKAWGPESRCASSKRHKLHEVGWIVSKIGGRQCKACLADQRRYNNAANRARRKAKRKMQPKPEPVVLEPNNVQAAITESIVANRILALIDKKERAETIWERNDIQEQIHALRRSLTA